VLRAPRSSRTVPGERCLDVRAAPGTLERRGVASAASAPRRAGPRRAWEPVSRPRLASGRRAARPRRPSCSPKNANDALTRSGTAAGGSCKDGRIGGPSGTTMTRPVGPPVRQVVPAAIGRTHPRCRGCRHPRPPRATERHRDAGEGAMERQAAGRHAAGIGCGGGARQTRQSRWTHGESVSATAWAGRSCSSRPINSYGARLQRRAHRADAGRRRLGARGRPRARHNQNAVCCRRSTAHRQYVHAASTRTGRAPVGAPSVAASCAEGRSARCSGRRTSSPTSIRLCVQGAARQARDDSGRGALRARDSRDAHPPGPHRRHHGPLAQAGIPSIWTASRRS
jgi:hypothetical protein